MNEQIEIRCQSNFRIFINMNSQTANIRIHKEICCLTVSCLASFAEKNHIPGTVPPHLAKRLESMNVKRYKINKFHARLR